MFTVGGVCFINAWTPWFTLSPLGIEIQQTRALITQQFMIAPSPRAMPGGARRGHYNKNFLNCKQSRNAREISALSGAADRRARPGAQALRTRTSGSAAALSNARRQ